ncbi:MAG: beta-lactamase family protein [bacterium]|nr:beta-lactamase family protein [bacterium]
MKRWIALITLACAFVSLAVANGLPTASPEEVGLSPERLERITKRMEADVAAGRIPGALAMVIRNGKVAYLETRGHADREAKQPMAADTIFRIYSMSKPITSVAVMMLYEEARLRITDPVSKYIPDLGGLKVYAGQVNGTHVLEDSERDITVQDLLRHTSGLTYGFFAKSAVDKMYVDKKVLSGNNLAEFVEKLGKIPLKHQPGSRWEYSVSTDVLGRLVEVISGQSFDEFLAERIFAPLKMVDTAFYVPPEKADRFAKLYSPNPRGGIWPADPKRSRSLFKKPTFFSGGGGLVSTAADYARFCQMMLNGGELDGVRLLSRKTVDLMRISHTRDIPGPRARNGEGFGLGFAVAEDLTRSGLAGSVGEYRWGGAAGTRFWIDPKENFIGIYMVQILPHTGLQYGNTFKYLAYQAIAD